MSKTANRIWVTVSLCILLVFAYPAISDISARTQQLPIEQHTVATYETWRVIETGCSAPGTQTGSKWRHHIVSPDGTWYIVPEYYKAEVAKWTDGQPVQLPDTVTYWDSPSGDTHVPAGGYMQVKRDSAGYEHTTRAIRVFVR